ARVRFDLDIESEFEADQLAVRLYGLGLVGSEASLADVLAEELRLRVVDDPASNSGLLDLAASTDDWENAVLGSLPADSTHIRLPDTPPISGRALVEQIAQAATDGLS